MEATENSEPGQPLAVPLSDQLGLVAKLRDPAQATNWGAADNLMNEAADEIERLRADRDSWAQQAADRAQDAIDLVAAERERCAQLCDDEFPRLQSSAERDLCVWLAQRIRKA